MVVQRAKKTGTLLHFVNMVFQQLLKILTCCYVSFSTKQTKGALKIIIFYYLKQKYNLALEKKRLQRKSMSLKFFLEIYSK